MCQNVLLEDCFHHNCSTSFLPCTSSMNLNDWSLNYYSSSMKIVLAICPKINDSPSGVVIVKQVKLMAVISANGKITSMPKVDNTLRRGRYEC